MHELGKQDLLKILKKLKKDVTQLAKKCQKAPGKQIQSKALLESLESLGTLWFEEIEPVLRTTTSVETVLIRYQEFFGKLLELSGSKPSKKVVVQILDQINQTYHSDIVVPVQKHRAVLSKYPKLDSILSHAAGLEVDYLTEAIECTRLAKRRAGLILGWCAAVNRVHLYVQKKDLPNSITLQHACQ